MWVILQRKCAWRRFAKASVADNGPLASLDIHLDQVSFCYLGQDVLHRDCECMPITVLDQMRESDFAGSKRGRSCSRTRGGTDEGKSILETILRDKPFMYRGVVGIGLEGDDLSCRPTCCGKCSEHADVCTEIEDGPYLLQFGGDLIHRLICAFVEHLAKRHDIAGAMPDGNSQAVVTQRVYRCTVAAEKLPKQKDRRAAHCKRSQHKRGHGQHARVCAGTA